MALRRMQFDLLRSQQNPQCDRQIEPAANRLGESREIAAAVTDGMQTDRGRRLGYQHLPAGCPVAEPGREVDLLPDEVVGIVGIGQRCSDVQTDLDLERPQRQAEILLERAVSRSDETKDQTEAQIEAVSDSVLAV